MTDLPAFLAFLPGLLAGPLCISIIFHWVRLFLSALGRNPEESSSSVQSGRGWMLLFSIIHPVPWLIGLGLPYAAYHYYLNPPSMGWRWFFGGILFSIALIFTVTIAALRKQPTKTATGSESTADHSSDAK